MVRPIRAVWNKETIVDYTEFETAIAHEVEPEVAGWDLFEQYVHAAWDAGKSVRDAADEVEDQYGEHT